MAKLSENPLIRELLSLDLPREDFVIAGSGPLLAHGLKTSIHDVDVVARGRAWSKAMKLGKVVQAPREGVSRIVLMDGNVEILNGWFPSIWSIDKLIDEAEVIEGLRFVQLSKVLEVKRALGRDKDKEDIELLVEFFNAQKNDQKGVEGDLGQGFS